MRQYSFSQLDGWISDISSETLLKALRVCWIDVYLDPPYIIVHNAGKTFMGTTVLK